MSAVRTAAEIDSSLADQAAAVLAEQGLTLHDALRLLLVNKNNKIPKKIIIK